MLLHLQLIAFLANLSFAANDHVPCAKWWGTNVQFTVPGQCFHAGKFAQPQQQGHYSFEIIATSHLESDQAYLDEAAQHVYEAVQDTIWQYETLSAKLSDVVIIFMHANDPIKAYADTYRPKYPEGPCQTRIFPNFKTLSPIHRKQAIAHELFHCVMQTVIGLSTEPAGWWVEGSASYFMNWIYPSGNLEWEHNAHFNVLSSLYKQPGLRGPYSTEQFFQSLEMRKGPTGILNWVLAQTFSDSLEEERTRLSNDAGFADDFHHWAKQYSAGHIRDTDGTYPGLHQILTKEVALHGERSAHVRFGTFKIKQFRLDVKPGRTIQMQFRTKRANIRAARKENGVWMEVPSAPAHGQEGFMELPCNNGNLIPILILLTSTDDQDVAEVELVIDEIKKNKKCKCEAKRRRKRFALSMPEPYAQTSGEESVDEVTVLNGGKSEPEDSSEDKCEEKPEEVGSCEGSTLAIDPCFVGKTWKLDPSATERLLKEKVGGIGVEGFTVNSVKVGGTGALTLGKNSTFQYKDYTVDMSITAAEMTLPIRTVINGYGDAELNMLTGGSGTGSFCLKVTKGEGKAVGSNPLIGDLTFDIGKNFIDQRMAIQYTCTASSLNIMGSTDGVQWGPFAYNG